LGRLLLLEVRGLGHHRRQLGARYLQVLQLVGVGDQRREEALPVADFARRGGLLLAGLGLGGLRRLGGKILILHVVLLLRASRLNGPAPEVAPS